MSKPIRVPSRNLSRKNLKNHPAGPPAGPSSRKANPSRTTSVARIASHEFLDIPETRSRNQLHTLRSAHRLSIIATNSRHRVRAASVVSPNDQHGGGGSVEPFGVGGPTPSKTLVTLPISSGGEEDANPELPLLGSSHDLQEEAQTCFQRFKGIFAMLIGTMLTALNPQIIFYVQGDAKCCLHLDYSPSCFLMWSFMMYSALNGIPFVYAASMNFHELLKPFRENRKYIIVLLLRGLCGSLIMFTYWNALDYFQRPAPVAVICAMAPILVYINAFFVLHEKLGIIPIINAVIAILGVVVMNLEDFLDNDKPVGGGEKKHSVAIGTAIALITMYLLSWATVLVRLLREVNPIIINLSFGFFGTTVMGVIAMSTGKAKGFYESQGLGLCFLTSVISTISNFLFNYALKHEQAGIVSLVRTSEVVFQFTYQYFFFGYLPQKLTAVGASMIIFGVICISLRKIVIESEENSKIRKYFGFLRY